MPSDFDLNGYFERIGWQGGRAPTYETVAGLLHAHTARIPFENFDVLLGRPVRLDLPSLQAKLVEARRGGYCFEHATLFAAALEALGLQPVRHAARVTLFQQRSESPKTHMFLTLALDGVRYMLDPGFGFYCSRAPVKLDGADASTTPRIARDGNDWVLQVRRDGVEIAGWVSNLEPAYPVDFEVANHFIASHPASPFVNAILASACTQEGRVNLMNRDMTRITGDAVARSQLPDRASLRALLATDFGFDLPEVEALRVPSLPDWA